MLDFDNSPFKIDKGDHKRKGNCQNDSSVFSLTSLEDSFVDPIDDLQGAYDGKSCE